MTHQSPFFDGFTYQGEKTYSCGGQTHTVHEYRHQKTGMDFVLIPQGAYWVCGDGNEGEVRLEEYLIGKYPVTQKVYEKITGENPSYHKGENRPVELVGWREGKDFCHKTDLSLPTEVEWEVACRAGTKTKFYWGETWDNNYGWSVENSGQETHPVGEKKPNAYGLYDMSGNVKEWCLDWYDGHYPSGKANPFGPPSGSERVNRGGSYYPKLEECASGCRGHLVPEYRFNFLGFRCVFRPGG